MGTQTDTFICVVFHHSHLRTEGYNIAKEFYQSWKDCKFRMNLVILDNESTCNFDFIDTTECDYIRIDNQEANGGITGAWNTIVKYAIDKGARVVMGFNDDVVLNDSLEVLATNTIDSNKIYVPVTDGMHDAWIEQKSETFKKGYRLTVKSINGFFMSFTSDFWKQKAVDDKLFIHHKFENGEYIDDWAGQELMLWLWNAKYNTDADIIGDCWIHHKKLRSWKKARKYYKYES